MSNIESNFPTEKKQSPEEQRQELIRRMNEATGGAGDLAEVLSYFPDKAELFIKTQEHAAKVEGKKNVWWNIRHKTKGYGLNGDEIYQKDQFEYLGVKGLTGESLVKAAGEIDRLRGTASDAKPDQYYQSDEPVYNIFSVLEAEKRGEADEWQKMTLKLLEVKGVTKEEITLMREYWEAANKSRELDKQAMGLEQQAKQLREQGGTIVKEAAQKVIQARQGTKK